MKESNMMLRMSKNRNKKHRISAMAIKKVSNIKIENISEAHNAVINDLAKEVLIISKNDNDSNEVSITYDMSPTKKDDKIIGVALGTVDEVDPLSDSTSCHIITSKKECVVVSLHNHPSLSIISLSDINFFLEYSSIKIMVIISNFGKVSYITKNEKYNSKKAIAYLNGLKKKHRKYIIDKGWHDAAIDLVKEFLNNCKKQGINYKKK